MCQIGDLVTSLLLGLDKPALAHLWIVCLKARKNQLKVFKVKYNFIFQQKSNTIDNGQKTVQLHEFMGAIHK